MERLHGSGKCIALEGSAVTGERFCRGLFWVSSAVQGNQLMLADLISCRQEKLLPLTCKANTARVTKEPCSVELLRKSRKNWNLRMVGRQ